MNDDELCSRLQELGLDSEGGRAAFTELYRRYYRPAVSRAYRSASDWGIAEDAASEAFTRTLQAISRGRGPRESFAGYLMTAVAAVMASSTQTERHSDVVDPETLDLVESSERTRADGEYDLLSRAFSALPEQTRQALWMTEVEGLTREQAASRIEVSIPAYTSILFRAREALRGAYLQQVVSAAPHEGAELLGQYVRGSLGVRQRSQMERHLAGCTECRQQSHRLRDFNRYLRSMLGPALVGGGATLPLLLAGSGDPAVADAQGGASVQAEVTLRSKPFLLALWAAAGVLLIGGLGAVWILTAGSGSDDATPQHPVVSVEIETEGQQSTDPEHPADAGAQSDAPRTGAETGSSSRQTADPPRLSGDDATPNWKVIEDTYRHLRK